MSMDTGKDKAGWFEAMAKDVRYGLRQFVRNPVFTVVAVLSLALGIGANTAIFSIMNAALLKTLPARDPQQLVVVTDPNSSGVSIGMDSGGPRSRLSFVEYTYLRDHTTVMSGMFASQSQLDRLTVRIADSAAEEARGRLVTENYFSVLGVEPAIGRFFNPAVTTAPGSDPEAVISYDYWQQRFGGKTNVLGTPIRVFGTTLTIIGVGAPGFHGETVGRTPDLWLPMMMEPLVKPGRDWLHEDLSQTLEKVMWLQVFGRLKPGATVPKAQAEMDVLFRQVIETGYPTTLSPESRKDALDQHIKVHEAGTGVFTGRDDFAQQLVVLLAVAGLVLLISCVNVANLLLARATARQKEVGIRLSIGASKARLVRQFLTESLLLSVFGGLLGALVALAAARSVVHLFSRPQDPLQLSTGIDLRVLGFTMALTVLTGLLFGLAPAIRATHVDLNESLKETGPSVTHSGRRLTFAKALVVLQVGLSLLLVVGAGLFLRTLWNLQSVSLGYARENLLLASVDGISTRLNDGPRVNFYLSIAERLRALPGVRGVTFSENGLFSGTESGDRIEVEGFTPKEKKDLGSSWDQIGAGYFSTIGIPLILGREIGPQDTPSAPKVCMINETFAKHFFEGRNPIGRHITQIFGDQKSVLEVIGVAKDARDHGLRGDVPPRFYLPIGQPMSGPPDGVNYELRTVADPQKMVEAVRKAILEVNADVPIKIRLLSDNLEAQNFQPRIIAQLCTIFGTIALLLAAIGLYGVLSYGVARRTNEIGIRMALGAGWGRVVGMILKETSVMIVIGLVAGVIAVFAFTRLIAARLYGLSALDPLTMTAAACILATVALVAGYIPAARAARVNPVKALRHE
jgi:predicted permease